MGYYLWLEWKTEDCPTQMTEKNFQILSVCQSLLAGNSGVMVNV